jgi:hypothetical protein
MGLGPNDIWWLVVGAFVTVFAGAAAIKTKLGMSWLARRSRRAFVEWFGAAIDTHVAPKFDEIRDELHATAEATQANSRQAATVIKQEALDTSVRVREEMLDALRVHAEEEMPLVRQVVEEALAPLAAILDERTPLFVQIDSSLRETREVLHEHMEHDETLRAEDGKRLIVGQKQLLDTLNGHHAEAMAKHAELADEVHEHIGDNSRHRTETKLEDQ